MALGDRIGGRPIARLSAVQMRLDRRHDRDPPAESRPRKLTASIPAVNPKDCRIKSAGVGITPSESRANGRHEQKVRPREAGSSGVGGLETERVDLGAAESNDVVHRPPALIPADFEETNTVLQVGRLVGDEVALGHRKVYPERRFGLVPGRGIYQNQFRASTSPAISRLGLVPPRQAKSANSWKVLSQPSHLFSIVIVEISGTSSVPIIRPICPRMQ
jgi:hypothetical protein